MLADCVWPFLWGEQALGKAGEHGDRPTVRRGQSGCMLGHGCGGEHVHVTRAAAQG